MALEEIEGLSQETAPLKIDKPQRSYNGLAVVGGIVMEECNRDLVWPQCMRTYKDMAKDAIISPALNLMEMSIAKAEWHVRIPEGYEEELKGKAKFLESVMKDLDEPWNNIIRNISTFARYGFAPVEKVYYERRYSNGSRYDDGLIGLKKLPLIAQDTVASWEWSEDGRNLTGLKQNQNIPRGEGELGNYTNEKVFIPRDKFILFRADPQKDSPTGTSPLNSVYVAWRFKVELERHESISIANDLRGMKVFYIPPRYMTESASEEEKATYEAFKEMLRGLHTGEQSGVIIPHATDDRGNPLFKFEVVNVMGQAAHNINEVISRYRREIITGILNPQLILGQDGGGSFALAESLGGVANTVVEARLKEIRDQLNHDLIPQLFAVNGFKTDVLPYFDFVQPDSISLDELSKFIQRVASVGLIKQDSETVNWIAEQAGMPVPFDSKDIPIEEVRNVLTGNTSRAGDGLSTPGEGTSTSVFGGDDSSVSNLENV